MNEHSNAQSMLTEATGWVRPPSERTTSRDPVYDFEHLGSTLADNLSAAADDLVAEANRIAQDTRELAAKIRTAVGEQSQLMADINSRLKATGEQMLEAHRKFSGT